VSISINVTPAASGGTFTVGSTSSQNVTLEVTGGIGPPGTDVALAAGTGISIVTVNNTATISSTVVIPDNLADLSDVTLGNVTSGQVLAYNGTAWTAAADNALTLSTSAGSDLGTAAIGTSGEAARADHVHNLPTFAEITNGTATVTGNLTLNASTGSVTLNGGTAGSGSLTLNCEQNTHGVTIQGPPHSAAATYTLTLPTSDGAANQVLQTDGSGSLSWADQSAGGGITWATEPAASNSSGTAGQIAYGSGFFYLHDGTEWRRAALSTFGTSTPTITIATQPQDLTLADGGSGNFTIAATVSDGSTPSYQWQNSDDSGATWDTLTGSTGTTYSLSGVSAADNGTQYRAIVSAAGASNVTSNVATLTVTAAATYDLLAENGDRLMTEAGDSLDHDGTGGGGSGSTWTQVGADIDGEAAYDLSGYSVAMSSDGSRVAIGARNNDDASTNAGHVRVYDLVGSTWTQVGADIDGEAAGDSSGHSVALSSDGSRVAIGAVSNDDTGESAGHVRVYDWSGSTWTQVGADIDGEAVGDYSGYSVALSSDGSRVAIGASSNDGTGTSAGHVRVYDWSGSTWTQVGADIDGEAVEDFSGRAVAISSDGSRVAIGAFSNDGTGTNAGHVRVYDLVGSTWTQVGADIDGEAADDSSGWSVAMSSDGSRVAIGAIDNDGTGGYAGHVRVYDWA